MQLYTYAAVMHAVYLVGKNLFPNLCEVIMISDGIAGTSELV